MLSLCLENAELKEQMGEAMSDGWEVEEDKEKGEVMAETAAAKGGLGEGSLQAEFRKVQGKLKSAYNIINLLKEQLVLSGSEGHGNATPELLVRLAKEVDRMNMGLPSPGKHQHQEPKNVTTRPGPRPQSLNLEAAISVDALQVSEGRCEVNNSKKGCRRLQFLRYVVLLCGTRSTEGRSLMLQAGCCNQRHPFST